jgi:hypothetical protein
MKGILPVKVRVPSPCRVRTPCKPHLARGIEHESYSMLTVKIIRFHKTIAAVLLDPAAEENGAFGNIDFEATIFSTYGSDRFKSVPVRQFRASSTKSSPRVSATV